VFIEQVPNYGYKAILEDGPVRLGSAKVVRVGKDASVFTYGRQVHAAVTVANDLSALGVEVEVVDLRSLAPLDIEALVTSAQKTRRVLVFHEAVVTGGFGAEIAASISEACFGDLETPVRRLGAADSPLPYAPGLERAALPSAQRLSSVLAQMLGLAAPEPR
jgi:pyruvate/2-oxoglutarate/acetoin dehydrogenase E1 component